MGLSLRQNLGSIGIVLPTDPPAQPLPSQPRVRVWMAGALLVVAAVVAYHNTFSGPFEFDDPASITSNASIRHLWPLIGPNSPLSPPPGGLTVTGRPLLNLSFALNYAGGEYNVRGYHIVNLAIHALAGLLLFGLLRRTLLRVSPESGYTPGAGGAAPPAAAALPLALAIAMLWIVHPLATESVTYIVQRAESLMGLWYLLTLYGFVRAVADEAVPGSEFRVPSSRRSKVWLGLSVLACLAGMATKEVMVSAPLLVLLYDRTFVAGSFTAAWRARRGYYLGLVATWGLLAWLMIHSGNRNATAGFDTPMAHTTYLLTQCRALALYAKLSIWPHPLVFDYGTETVERLGEVWFSGLAILVALAATGYAVWRRSWLGVAGTWCFAILAPTSSFVPIASQTMAEHRMYLPLAGVLTAIVVGLYTWLGRWGLHAVRVATVVFAAMTVHRNELFRSDLTVWTDVMVKRPNNYRAYNDYGYGLSVRGQIKEAIPYYEKSIALKPDFPDAHNNYGYSLTMLDRYAEAIPHFLLVLGATPLDPPANLNLGNALMKLGRAEEAVTHYRTALLNDPSATVHDHLALALLTLGRAREAVPEYEAALRLEPNNAADWAGLGYGYESIGRPQEAVVACRRAIDLAPNLAEAQNHLGIALAQLGRNDEAIAAFEAALRIDPGFADAHNNLGNMLLNAGRIDEAINHYQRALDANPEYADAEHNLGEALRRAGHPDEAAVHFEAAKRLRERH